MEEQNYRVIFKGEITPNANINEVKEKLAALFKVNIKEVDQLFSGKPFILKDNTNLDEANKYKEQFEKTGAHCIVAKITETKPQHQPPPSPSPRQEIKAAPDGKNTCISYEIRYRLMFNGEISVDKDINEVKTNLSIFYKVKPERIEAFFSGKPVPIIGPTDFWTSVSYLDRFKECGAVGYLETVAPGEAVEDSPDKFKIVFCGEIQEDNDLLAVKARLASLFKVSGVVVDKLFLAKPVLIRTGLTQEAARSFKANFEKAGAVCQMLKISDRPQPVLPKYHGVEIEPADISSPLPGLQPMPEKVISSPPYRPEIRSEKPIAHHQPLQVRKRNSSLIIFIVIVVIVSALIIFKIISGPGKEPESTAPKQVISTPRRTPQAVKPRPSPQTPQANPKRSSSLLAEQSKSFEDPKKYYSITLPEGYLIINESKGNQSKILFNYSLNVNITIIAYPLPDSWNPQEAMLKKVADIENGNAGALSRLNIENRDRINFRGLDGYEIILLKGNQLAHVYELASPNKILFSITIAAVGENNQENHNTLDTAVRDTLQYKSSDQPEEPAQQ